MPYKGPGFYNESGERVCSFHPESMMEFIDMAIDGYWPIHASEDYEEMKECIVEEIRRDEKNELYGPRKAYQLDFNWP
tara:strand:- start:367 stop:600 length:234 start_codon:yes stop_codon:yes gene_type:complete